MCGAASPPCEPVKHLIEVDWQRIDRDLLVGNTDQDAGSVGVGEVIGLFDDLFDTSRFDHLVRALGANDVADRGGNILDFGGIERVGCTACLRHVELAVNQIDRNDRVRAGQMRELHDVEPDSTNTENND